MAFRTGKSEDHTGLALDGHSRNEKPGLGLDSSDDKTPRTPASILAITGSLRAQSSNTAVLRAAALVAPPGIRVTLFADLAALPHFNPDLDRDDLRPPPAVADFRERVFRADALLICSPEYAHGVPGSLKNALDWLVSVPELYHKPVGLLNASRRAFHANESLAETLRTMSLLLVPAATITVPLDVSHHSAEAIAADMNTRAALRGAIEALVVAARDLHRGI